MSRRRIAIAGGGMSGLTAALALTATPELREQHEVTVYQLGWRLGGKCATGRNQDVADRIQEHGLHLWFGAYDNAFAMLRRCYDELNLPESAPIRRIEQAFVPLDTGALYDNYGEHWSTFVNRGPENLDVPGDVPRVPLIFDVIEDLVARVIDDIEEIFHFQPRNDKTLGERLPDWARMTLRKLETPFFHLGDDIESGMLHLVRALSAHQRSEGNFGEADRSVAARMIAAFRDWAWEHHFAERVNDDTSRHKFETMDLLLSVGIGILADDLMEVGFPSVDHLDFREWLLGHGLQPVSADGPLVRSFYSQIFAVNRGPSVLDLDEGHVQPTANQPPSYAAGVGAMVVVREFLMYRGSVLWKPICGFADVVVSPMYNVLLARGVKFEYFARVDNIGLSSDRQHVDTLSITTQARMVNDAPYQPLLVVKGIDAWPSAPLWEQLDGGDELRAAGVDFERGQVDTSRASTRTLRRGEDFDDVLLAISVAALPPICREILADREANPRFYDMLAHSHTCMTQAFQVWSHKTREELGWTHYRSVASAYVEPLDTYCDMSGLVPRETWTPDDDTKSLAFFCGMLEDEPGDNDQITHARAVQGATDYLTKYIVRQWPGAAIEGTGEFNWDVLVDRSGAVGVARLQSQFVRANDELTERYVQTPAGTTKYRLRANESGYDNLFLAGDWTQNGLNVGCVESAVTSGLMASRAICGEPTVIFYESGL